MVVARNLWLVSHHQSKRAARWGAVKARIKYSHQLAPFKIVRCEGIVET